MATTTTTIAVFFLLLTLTSTTIHARESQFFAKVSNTPKDSLPLNTNNNNNNPQINNPQINTNQQDPTFVQQTQDSGFGLYGHESGQLPPADTTTKLPANLPENYNPVAYTTPIHSSTQDIPNEYNYEPQAFNNNNNGETKMYSSESQDQEEFMDNGKYVYAPENGYNSKNFDDTKFMETENGVNNNNFRYNIPKQGGNEMYNPQSQGNMGEEAKYVATNNNYNNNMYNIPGKQGMSDTRFLENGKYYYDLNSERLNVNNNNNANMNSRGVRNGFETQGYYSDNQNPQGYYDNSQNSYDRYNTNGGGYQNQEFTP